MLTYLEHRQYSGMEMDKKADLFKAVLIQTFFMWTFSFYWPFHFHSLKTTCVQCIRRKAASVAACFAAVIYSTVKCLFLSLTASIEPEFYKYRIPADYMFFFYT